LGSTVATTAFGASQDDNLLGTFQSDADMNVDMGVDMNVDMDADSGVDAYSTPAENELVRAEASPTEPAPEPAKATSMFGPGLFGCFCCSRCCS
jgi:hypothetical protein